MLIPFEQLSQDALVGIAKEYILQQLDGQYDPDFDIERATQTVLSAIRKGELVVNYSEVNESITLTSQEELQKNGFDGEFEDEENL